MSNSTYRVKRTPAYAPFQLSPNNAPLDEVILSTAPFGYWPCDDASGAPQDISGNANHGSASGSPVYEQDPITSKAGPSISLPDGLSVLEFPAAANLGDRTLFSAMGALIQFTGDGDNGDGNSGWRSFMGCGGAALGCSLTYYVDTATYWVGFKYNNTRAMLTRFPVDTSYPAHGNKHYVVLNAAPVDELDNGSMELWVDGVLVSYQMRDTQPGGTPDLFIGKDPDNTFWGAPAMKVSNVVSWDRDLTGQEIAIVASAALDTSAFYHSWRP